jgi:predicted nuclease of predicted toxin-antitoxin system
LDAQLPPRLAGALRSAGHEAWHVADLNLLRGTDGQIWQEALRRGAAIMTKDADFAQRRVYGGEGPTVIWIRIGNRRNTDLIAAIERNMPEIETASEAGETLIEIR